jgi:TPR repeat protein
MKISRFLKYALVAFLFSTLALSVEGYSQIMENPHFNAGIAALNANNMPLAFQEFLAAANEGDPDSQYNVALMYEQGIGVVKDEKKAFYWYDKSAKDGNWAAQFNLAVLYENGRGTPKDYAKANMWYRKAAAQGDGLAIGNLGMLYIRGEGVDVNLVAGVALLLWSATVDNSPENLARQNLSSTRDLTTAIVTEAQALSDELMDAEDFQVPLDAYLKK